MARTFLGTSGWSYDEWVGSVYPNRSTPKLKYYCSIFGTVEIDSTFYAYPNQDLVSGWIKNAPTGFQFSAKLPQIITHKKKLQDVESDLNKFLQLVRPISDARKLGAILIQLPPSFAADSIKILEDFLQLLPDDLPFAVEFRNKSWETKDTRKLLEKYHICNVITDSPLELISENTTYWSYLRFHGRGQKVWFDYRYSEKEMSKLAEKLATIEQKSDLVYGYFNNHYGGDAVENALQLIQLTGSLSSKQLEALNRFKVKSKDLDSFF